ncbi:hypothetical protein [Qipengyuania thermophila]|uniref:hypothetical protein n=1 Tax=Qipengyuania thermophila TaxID=2509361 RepID=UPI0013ED1CF0|nr:hypothetical protein [Qipengyuania thermophila]
MSAETGVGTSRRSVRIAIVIASTAVGLCFAAAFGLVQQPLKAETAQSAARTD